MADIGRLEFKKFDLGLALKGAKLAWAKETTGKWNSTLNETTPPDIDAERNDDGTYSYGNLGNIVENFRESDISNNNAKAYMAEVDNVMYYFNYDGYCSDNNPLHRIYILDAYIAPSEGTVATRGDSLEPINIASLQPREHFAQTAMLGILYNTPNPLSLTKANVADIVEKAFEIANAMMQKTANIRKAVETNGGSGDINRDEEIEVNPDELTENSEKLMYNINENLYKIVNQGKEQFDEIKSSGLTIKPHSTAQFKVANVDGTVLSTKVTNTVDANIKSSSITVPVAEQNIVEVTGNVDANVSGTVSVDNFPSSVSVNNTVSVSGSVAVSNSPTVTVDNMPSEPIDVNVTNTVNVTGNVTTGGNSDTSSPTDPDGQE